MNWIDERIRIYQGFVDDGSTDFIEDVRTLEALKEAREALDVATTPLAEDRQKVLSAIRKIDALGKK